MEPTSSLLCQHLSHLLWSVLLTFTLKPSISLFWPSSVSAMTLASEVININLNSSENFSKRTFRSSEQYSSISASKAEPIRPSFLEFSIILLTSDLILRILSLSSLVIEPSEEQTQSSYHSDKWTDSYSLLYKRQASSAVKLSIGEILLTMDSKIWYNVVWQDFLDKESVPQV